jgi:hypothetical protein
MNLQITEYAGLFPKEQWHRELVQHFRSRMANYVDDTRNYNFDRNAKSQPGPKAILQNNHTEYDSGILITGGDILDLAKGGDEEYYLPCISISRQKYGERESSHFVIRSGLIKISGPCHSFSKHTAHFGITALFVWSLLGRVHCCLSVFGALRRMLILECIAYDSFKPSQVMARLVEDFLRIHSFKC